MNKLIAKQKPFPDTPKYIHTSHRHTHANDRSIEPLSQHWNKENEGTEEQQTSKQRQGDTCDRISALNPSVEIG